MTINIIDTLRAAGDFPLASYSQLSDTPSPGVRFTRSNEDEEVGLIDFTADGQTYRRVLQVNVPELKPTFLRRSVFVPNNDTRGEEPSVPITEALFLGENGATSNERIIPLRRVTLDRNMWAGVWIYLWFPLVTIAGESLGDPSIPTPAGSRIGELEFIYDTTAFGGASNQLGFAFPDSFIMLEVAGRMGRVYRSATGGFNTILPQISSYYTRLERLDLPPEPITEV